MSTSVAPAAKTVAEAKVHEPGHFCAQSRSTTAPSECSGCRPTNPPLIWSASWSTLDASWQRRGIGRRAVALLPDDLRTAGHTELELSYVPAEDGAERFWLNCGFEPAGRMHGGEVVVRMDL